MRQWISFAVLLHLGFANAATNSTLQDCLNKVFASNKGAVHYPQDFLYQSLYVKPYNTAIHVTPAAVTRPSTAQDVAGIVQCAAASSVKVQPRSGGHSYGNYGIGGEDGAVVVDLANFQQFSMDNTTWKATIGAGTLLADVTDRLHNAGGRAIAHGTCPQVGIGGHATIGGLGPISRQWGSALDHVLEVEIVLANGTITRANATYNPDILFAVKGAAASFGIVTEFVFMTRPEPSSAILYTYKLQLTKHADLAPTFAAWQDIVSDPNLDRKLASEVIVFQLGMIISGTYFGTRDEYNALNFEGRLTQNATSKSVSVLDSWLGVVGNWAETEALKLIGGVSGAFYSKSLTFKSTTLIPMSGIQTLFNYFDTADKGTLVWFAIFDVEGGAVNDVPQNATAYAHRDAQFYMQTYAVDINFSGTLSNTTAAFVQNMSDIVTNSMPGVEFGAYAGYVDPKLPNGQQQYWGTNLPRLESIKASIDPHDLFHNPQSVRPQAGSTPQQNGTQPSTSGSGAQGQPSSPSTGGGRRRVLSRADVAGLGGWFLGGHFGFAFWVMMIEWMTGPN
ncbi:Reticuline oxidase [Favolaschia claudopus]|uniref:Reticuline oxidase n=1 Tax=Favolaschia claudopus TaxID=2862362 RepID=A0AAV9ZDM0_9AGAR